MNLVELRPIVVLHFFHAEGCHYCAEAEPIVAAFRRKYPLRVLVVPHNVTRQPEFRVGGWKPKGTPGYAVEIEGKLAGKREGVLQVKDLERLVGKDNL